MGLIPGSRIKTNNIIGAGIVQEWDEDLATGEPYWAVYYKTVKFGDFEHLDVASERLQQLVELDSSTPVRKPTPPSPQIKKG